jgi:hypothetical protein
MKKRYVPSGEGYFIDSKDPSKGFYGLSPEIEKQKEREFEERLFLEEINIRKRKLKAIKLLEGSGSRDIGYKINSLQRLKYKKINIKGGVLELNKIKENEYPYLERFYQRTLNELREIINNPNKKSKLVERLDSIE